MSTNDYVTWSSHSWNLGKEPIRDAPLEKWWGKNKINSCNGRWRKKDRAKKKWRKQSESHCRAYKLYSVEGYLGNHFILQFSFVGPDEILIHVILSTIGKTDIFPFQDWYILWAATSSRTLVAKTPCRKPLMDKQPSCLIRLRLNKHILSFESLYILKWFHNWHV